VKVETFLARVLGRVSRVSMTSTGREWAISAIPLGGYVKFKGDANEASVPDHAAAAAMSDGGPRTIPSPTRDRWQRAAIVAAGPLANFILAFLIFATLFSVFGRTQQQPIVGTVIEKSAAAEAGFAPGDRRRCD